LRSIWLSVALLPYLALAGFDAWLHEKSRRVPRLEQALHAGAAISLLAFIAAAFASAPIASAVALAVFLGCAGFDEFGFHAPLAARERRVHFASYAALGLFVLVWWSQGRGA
jgi:hypothetical protein